MVDTSDKNKVYIDIVSWTELNDAHRAFSTFHSYIVANRIFLHPDLKAKFDTVDGLMWKMWVTQQFDRDYRNQGNGVQRLKEFRENDSNIKQLLTDIEALVQNRIYPV
jgi:hypothetical protein